MTLPPPSTTHAAAPRRERWILAAVYAGAILSVAMAFVGYRVRVHHATFAARGFFWTGDLHRDDRMGFSLAEDRSGTAILNHGIADPSRRIAVRTDAHGLRIPLGQDPNLDLRGGICAIGCSCTFAHGVAAESSYVEVAGRLLGLPAANLGVCAYSPVTSALQLEKHIARLQPRAVVYGFGNFHLERAARPRADSELFHAWAVCEDGACRIEPPAFDNRRVFSTAPAIERLYYAPRLAGEPVPLTPARIRAVLPLAVQDLARALHPTTWRLRFAPAALPEAAFCRFILDRMYRTCREHDAEFVLLWFPKELGDRPAPGLLDAVESMRGQAGFTFVDCSGGLFAAAADQESYAARWQVPRDGHPNRFMHAEMGRAIAAALAPRLGAAHAGSHAPAQP